MKIVSGSMELDLEICRILVPGAQGKGPMDLNSSGIYIGDYSADFHEPYEIPLAPDRHWFRHFPQGPMGSKSRDICRRILGGFSFLSYVDAIWWNSTLGLFLLTFLVWYVDSLVILIMQRVLLGCQSSCYWTICMPNLTPAYSRHQ